MFAWVVGAGVVIASLGVAAWCVADVRRRATGRAAALTLLLLGGGLASVPLGLAPDLPVRSSTTHYAGPDLLSDEAPVTELVGVTPGMPGFSRERRTRTTQAGVLLHESTRTEVGFPVLFCLVALGWLAVRGRWPVRADERAGGADTRAGATLSLFLLLMAAGCSDAAPPPPSTAEALLIEALEMRRTGETDGVLDVFHPVATWEDHPSQTEYRGAEEIAVFIRGLHAWADGVFLDVVRIYALGDVAVAEWVLEGSQARPIPGLMDSVTHRRFRVEGVTLVEIEGNSIVRAVDYADTAPLFLGMGGRITLPDGSMISRPDSTQG